MGFRRVFLITFNEARTDARWRDPVKAGRMDILFHSVIHGLFTSNALRTDTALELLLLGPPRPPVRMRIEGNPETPFSKKDIGTLIRIAIHKLEKGKKNPFPGVFVSRDGFSSILTEYLEGGYEAFWLDPRGEPIWNLEFSEEKRYLFVLGDHEGIPSEVKRELRRRGIPRLSLGGVVYFTSQAITIIHHYLDRLGAELHQTEN